MYKYPGSGNFIKAFDIVRREIAFLKVLAEYEKNAKKMLTIQNPFAIINKHLTGERLSGCFYMCVSH